MALASGIYGSCSGSFAQAFMFFLLYYYTNLIVDAIVIICLVLMQKVKIKKVGNDLISLRL